MMTININGSNIDLYPNEGIGLTYSVGSILQLNQRSGFVSNIFKIPKTANNNSIMEFANEINSNGNTPYQLNTVDVFQDGIKIISEGGLIIQSVNNDSYSILITSGNIDFFDKIKDVTIADLDLSVYNHVCETDTFVNNSANTSGFKYPVIESGITKPCILNNIRPNTGDYNITIYNGRLIPAIFFKTIKELVEDYTGYVIKGTFLDTVFYDKALIFANNYYKEIDATVQKMERLSSDNLFFTSASRTYGVPVSGERVSNQLPFNDDDFVIPITNTVFEPNKLVTYKISVDLKLIWRVPLGNGGKTALALSFYECDSGGTYIGSSKFYTQSYVVVWDELKTGTTPVLTDVSIDFKGDVYFQFESGKYYRPFLIETIDTTGGTGTFQSKLTLVKDSRFEFSEVEAIYPNESVDMNLCFTQNLDDIFKDVIKINNLIVQTDSLLKEITFNTFDTLVGNITNAVDWDDKVDLSKDEGITFTPLNFAQKNWLRYSNTESLRNGYISLENLNIANETTIVSLKAKAVDEEFTYKDALAVSFSVPKMPIVEPEQYFYNPIKDAATYFLIDDTQNISNHNYIIRNVTDSTFGSVTDSGLVVSNIPFAYFVKTDSVYSLDWDSLIALNYKPIVRMFDRFKLVKNYMRLSSIDINTIDFSVPAKYKNGFYYINKISNHKSNRSTLVELIQL